MDSNRLWAYTRPLEGLLLWLLPPLSHLISILLLLKQTFVLEPPDFDPSRVLVLLPSLLVTVFFSCLSNPSPIDCLPLTAIYLCLRQVVELVTPLQKAKVDT